MRILRLLLIGSLLAFTACKSSQAPQGPAPDPNDYLSFLQVNDVYEIAPIQGGKYGGMARLATLKKQLREEKPPLFTVMAGDFLSPSVIGTVKIDGQRIKGAHMVDIMNAVGFDLVCFGNHEFDLKEAELQARLDESEFEWIAGNVRQNGPEGPQAFLRQELPIEVTKVLQVPRTQGSSLRIGVMSLCLPANQQDYVHYEDLKESALAQWKDLLPRSDFIIALTHLSIDQDRDLATWLPGLKLIMGGHEHEHHYEVVGGVPIAKADANAKTAYVHRVSFNRFTGEVSVKSELNAIDETLSLDPEVTARVQTWEEKAYAAFKAQGLDLSAPVASLETPLDGLESHIRTRQTNLGQAMTQAMYQAWDSVDCALANGGMVRLDDYLAGDITQFDLVRALPFGGKVIRVKMQGHLLRQVLESGQRNIGSGGYLQWHLIQLKGGKWYIGGQPLDPDSVYSVAMGDFLLTGLEQNLGYLTPENPAIVSITHPAEQAIAGDVRLALAEYLKNR